METIVSILEIVGIISFSAAGAMVAIDKQTDIFGVVFLAIITCFGGGMLRDVLCGGAINLDRPWFFSGAPDANLYITISVITAIAVFFIAAIFKKQYVKEEKTVLAINNILDAIGIGVFSSVGTGNYLSLGPFVAIMMGMISSIGGGLMRDVILRDIPFVLRKYIYAVATIAGSAIYYMIAAVWMPDSELGRTVALIVGTLVIFLIRVIATYFRLNMPKAIDFDRIKREVSIEDGMEAPEFVLPGRKK